MERLFLLVVEYLKCQELTCTSHVAVKGVGVHIEDSVYSCPSMDESVLAPGLMLQNLPSIQAVVILDPQPGERILDMCAAPGGKTCHIAARLQGKGRVVAFDKSSAKVATIQRNAAKQYLADMVSAHVMDGTKSILDLEETETDPPNLDSTEVCCVPPRPPFPPATFDRVLVDAPCSALGQRPQFYNNIKVKELDSFPKIQRKLLRSGVKHLKPGGILVYSTCTNNVEENERMTELGPPTDGCLEKVEIDPTSGLNYQLFGHPRANHDTISFFVAKFKKKI